MEVEVGADIIDARVARQGNIIFVNGSPAGEIYENSSSSELILKEFIDDVEDEKYARD